MNSKNERYTGIERAILIKLVNTYIHVIEGDQSDETALLKQRAAWEKIHADYNNSSEIFNTKTLQQLKKMWTFVKHYNRYAFTKGKQACIKTEAGPPFPCIKIEPAIPAIVPHLKEMAPTNFSSNIAGENQNLSELVDKIFQQDIEEEGMIEEHLDKALPMDGFVKTESIEIEDVPIAPNKSSIPQAETQAARNNPPTKGKRRREHIEDQKVQRMAGLCQQDKRLFEIKKQYEIKIARMVESHREVLHKMQHQHLRDIQKLELRKAKAEAELAEFRLAQETSHL